MRVVLPSLAALQLIACASVPPRAASEEIRRTAVSGAEIAYAVDGSGPPLVMVHGGWGDLRSFSRAAPRLAERRTVVRVSLRHHWPGAAPPSEAAALAGYGVETHAADVVALIERLGGGPAVVLGHSYGGIVAALVAQARPDLVERLVLVEPSLYGILRGHPELEAYIEAERRLWKGKLARIPEGQDPAETARVIYDETRPGTFDAFEERRRSIFLANARTVRTVLIRNWSEVPYTCTDARRIEVPVLLVEGERTDADMREINSLLLRCLPQARRVVLAGAGHSIQFDAPEAMARAVARFITE